MGKKGISPLIATVMLVAVVIVLAFLVFWWYGEYIEENLQKSEITAEQACLNDVSMRINEPGCLENATATGDKVVYFNVENNGDIKLYAFKANVDGNIDTTFVTVPQSVDQSVESKLSFVIDTTTIGTDLEITITPMVKAGGATKYCTDKAKAIVVDCT